MLVGLCWPLAILVDLMKKVCATCGESKNASPSKSSQFSWRKDRSRYYNDCKVCRNAKQRKKENEIQARVSNTEKEAIENNRYGFLAGAVVYQAVRDRADEFFETRWYEELRDAANIEECNVLRCRKHIGG